YYNCGDWVESCTALVEGDDGILSVLNYLPFSGDRMSRNRMTESLSDEQSLLARSD
ncbi:MAG: UDP-2,3-diacylglucosamine hydrolase, partial [Verrucomicrobia bacterium]